MDDVVTMLRGINLNLLVTLSALLSERSVTGAASRLGVTQPAASRSLSELRAILDDQLLVRSGNEMLLTPKAQELIAPLQRGLAELGRVVSGEGRFEAARSQRLFRISVIDYVASLFLPELLARLRKEAPGIRLDARQFPPDELYGLMESGEVDLLIGRQHDQEGVIRQQTIYTDHYACLMRADHPLASATLSLEQYVALPHILLSPFRAGEGVVDQALHKLGLERQIVLYQPYFLLVPYLLERSDMIITMPCRPATLIMSPKLRMYEPPVKLEPYDVGLRWHERFHDDLALRWLRQIVAECMALNTQS